MTEISIAILAGGKSLRMGTDKAELITDGMTLLERTAGAALTTGCPGFVVGRTQPRDWRLDEVAFIEDDFPDNGPIGGLATALRHCKTSVLALACDMPCITALAIQWLLEQASETMQEHGIITINGAQIEPLFSVYRQSCIDDARKRLESGRRSMIGLIQAGQFARANAPSWVANALLNVNTPEEFAKIEGQKP